MNFYPFHIGDFSSHTRHLSLMEDLAYRRMLDLYYTSESPLPADPNQIARLIAMRDHVGDVEAVLSDFFILADEGHTHPRCDREIAIYKAKAERAVSANKSRWSKDKPSKPMTSDAVSDQISDMTSDMTSDLISESDQIATNTNTNTKTNTNTNTKTNTNTNTKTSLNTSPPQQAGAPATFELVVPEQSPAKAKTAKPLDPDEQQGCKDAWAAYSQAYQNRYAVAPVRNAAVNAKVKQLVKRIGKDEAPGVCRFYVESVNDAFVVKKMHDMGLLLQGCEGYRTQWITGKAVTGESAKRVEKSQDQGDQMDEIRALIKQHRGAAQ